LIYLLQQLHDYLLRSTMRSRWLIIKGQEYRIWRFLALTYWQLTLNGFGCRYCLLFSGTGTNWRDRNPAHSLMLFLC